MAGVPPRGGRRTWKLVVGAMVVLFLILLALALLSEREDARVLPPEELEGVEEPYAPEPGDTPPPAPPPQAQDARRKTQDARRKRAT